MATFEERLQAVEQDNTRLKRDNAELRQKIELQTIAISGLVNKTVLEQVNNKNDKIFQTLINHDEFTNRQLAEIRTDISSLDGKTVGLQTEMRTSISNLDGKVVGLQTEMRQNFASVNENFASVNENFASVNENFASVNARFEAIDTSLAQILQVLSVLTQKPDQEK